MYVCTWKSAYPELLLQAQPVVGGPGVVEPVEVALQGADVQLRVPVQVVLQQGLVDEGVLHLEGGGGGREQKNKNRRKNKKTDGKYSWVPNTASHRFNTIRVGTPSLLVYHLNTITTSTITPCTIPTSTP